MSEDVTKILSALESGDRQAAGQLLPLVYEELRKLATRRMASEQVAITLQPTALVHEAFLRLVGPRDGAQGDGTNWDGRGHFFAAAAEAMRRILIDNARRRKREKRGGNRMRLELHDEHAVDPDVDVEDLLSLDEALTKLAEEDADLAKLVELRYFAGMTIDETARVMGVSPRTTKRNWAYARAWLHRHMEGTA